MIGSEDNVTGRAVFDASSTVESPTNQSTPTDKTQITSVGGIIDDQNSYP